MSYQEGAYFHEGEGFLFVRKLGNGDHYYASLVRSIADNQLYVRAEVKAPQEILVDNQTQSDFVCHDQLTIANRVKAFLEPGCYIRQPLYSVRWRKSDDYKPSFYVIIWEYYDIGTLADVAAGKHWLPEICVVKWLLSMLATTICMHKSGVVHRNTRARHWFLRSQGSRIPIIALGGWKGSVEKSSLPRYRGWPCFSYEENWIRRCIDSFEGVHSAILEICGLRQSWLSSRFRYSFPDPMRRPSSNNRLNLSTIFLDHLNDLGRILELAVSHLDFGVLMFDIEYLYKSLDSLINNCPTQIDINVFNTNEKPFENDTTILNAEFEPPNPRQYDWLGHPEFEEVHKRWTLVRITGKTIILDRSIGAGMDFMLSREQRWSARPPAYNTFWFVTDIQYWRTPFNYPNFQAPPQAQQDWSWNDSRSTADSVPESQSQWRSKPEWDSESEPDDDHWPRHAWDSEPERRHKARSKPETKPKPKPEPEPKPEPKPERKPESKPGSKPESKSESKSKPKPEPKPEPRPEPKPEPKPEPAKTVPRDPFEVLGIPKDSTEREVNKAYRKLALRLHPDKTGGKSDAAFKEVLNAKEEILKRLSRR